MTQCIACGAADSISIDEDGVPPLCGLCWNRAGEQIDPGAAVICTVDHPGCSGIVRSLVDDYLAIVETYDGRDAHVPFADLVPSST